MKKILIKNILLNDSVTDILIEGNRFVRIAGNIEPENGTVCINGSGKAILPPFYNTHTHAAMSLLRGYADDTELFVWLTQHIWPLEAKMTAKDIYIGSRLAMLEMIKSGTVFFSDMYWYMPETFRAAEEMKMRATLGLCAIESKGGDFIDELFRFAENQPEHSSRIQFSMMPHAIYTVGEKLFGRMVQTARRCGMKIHTHLSETQKEVNDCIQMYGCRPVQWLERKGFLGNDLILAHAVHIDPEEIQALKKHNVSLANNPCSNLKLASGIFPYAQAIQAGCRICIGTDGCSSNNNLDMHEEMKMAALLAKVQYGPHLRAEQAFAWATQNGAEAYGIDAGSIAEGKLADALIIRLNNERMTPCHNLISNWVYAADNSCIDTVICDGNLLMQNGKVDGEDIILAEAQKTAKELFNRL